MAVDPAVMEVTTPVEHVPPTDLSDALSLMREGLRETTTPPAAPDPAPEDATETPAAEGERTRPSLTPGSRRARTAEREVGKVLTESEQKIADAETARAAAETRAAELEAKLQEREQAPIAEAETARVAKLEAEYGDWVGTPEQYQSAKRWERMDVDHPEFDFDAHKQAISNLETWDARRKWAGTLTDVAKMAGQAEAHQAISNDFLVTLAEDLPEDKRAAYRQHKDGIPGAVRFYAESVYAPKLEALEGQVAERDAEIERLKTAGGSRRSPAPGGSGAAAGAPRLDYDRQTPEELMSAELRAQARSNGRR